ncbi:MAG: hypothetical protein K2L41_04275 [Muribaculaceae bacterium]|nr:hypothetical protein [Muribaculaceae bacterium]
MKSLSTNHRHTAIQLYFIISIMSMSAQSYDKLSDYIWDVPRTGKQLFADPSPEATAMRHFQDYPISYATGTANVSIPLVK